MTDEVRSPSGSADHVSAELNVPTASEQVHDLDEDLEEEPVVIPGHVLRQARSESYEDDWKDVYRQNGVDPERLLEDDSNTEKEEFTEQILEREHEEAYDALRHRAWIGFHISSQLSDIYEETGVYWMLEGTENGFEPVLKADDERLVIDPEYDPSKAEYDEETDPEKDHLYHPVDTLESSEYIDDLMSIIMNYSVEDIGEMPVLSSRVAGKQQGVPDSSDLYAPDFAEGYRKAVKETFEHES